MEGNKERFGSPKRGGTHTTTALAPPDLRLSAAEVTVKFRILCLRQQMTFLTRERVSTIQSSTESNICVVFGNLTSPNDFVSITAKVGSTSRVKLGEINGEEEEVEISKAQEALIRVFELLNDEIRTDIVCCWLLTEASHVGSVKGEDGESAESIRKQTGCSVIKIHTANLPKDAFVLIKGNVLSVKKALVAISGLLQDCQVDDTRKYESVDRALQASLQSPRDKNTQEALPGPAQVFPRSADTVCGDALSGSSDVSQGDDVFLEMELVLKILSPSETVGSINVEYIRILTGATVDVGDTPADCDECLITITSKIPATRKSPAERAIVLIFNRLYENSSRPLICARLVVPLEHVGWLLNEGTLFSDFWRIGTSISLFEVAHKCISEYDQVFEISGELSCVQAAIDKLTARLRDNLISRSTTISVISMPRRIPSGETTNLGSMGFGGLPFTSANHGLGSGHKSSTVTNHICLEENVSNFLSRAEDGQSHSRIQDMREISGAQVILQEPVPLLGKEEWVITISGTYDQAETAQQVLDAFVRIYESLSFIESLRLMRKQR